jgi:transposase
VVYEHHRSFQENLQIVFSFAEITPDYNESQDLSIAPTFVVQFHLVLKKLEKYYFTRCDTIYEHKFGFAESFRKFDPHHSPRVVNVFTIQTVILPIVVPLCNSPTMARASFLSDKERESIRTLSLRGFSVRGIAQVLKRSVGAVQNVLKASANLQPKKRLGSVSKVTAREKRHIIRCVSVLRLSAKKVKEKLKLVHSVRTIQRVIKSVSWLKYKKRGAAPALTKRHREARVKWAERMGLKDDDAWCQVAFSDEKKWNLDGPDGMRYEWVDTRRPKELNVRRHTGGGGVMIWGAFRADTKSELKFVDGKQDSVKYVSTLRTHLQPFIDAENHIFQQDNAAIHKSRYTMNWLQAQGIDVMDWPALSPDLNPIENLWGIMTQQVYEGGKQYNTKDELKKAVLAAWAAIPPKTLTDLTLSMRKRCIRVLVRRGAYIAY